MTEKWAILGGSFNPPHLAHVLVAASVLCATDVDRVVVIPTFQHPFGKKLERYDHRVKMTELAMRDLKRVHVSRIEEELGGDSYTVRTIEALHAQHPTVALQWIVGSDLVQEIPSWKDAERLTSLVSFLVIGRQGQSAEHATLPFVLPDISSTEIRRTLLSHGNIDALVPHEVARYIEREKLFAS